MTVQTSVVVVSCLTLWAAVAGAQPNKPPEKWTYEEAYRVLTDSAWAPAKTALDVKFDYQTVYRAPYSGVPAREHTDQRQGVIQSRISPTGKTPLPSVSVLWHSSRTVRLAQIRVAQFREILPKDAPLGAPPVEHIRIVVEGSEPLRILRDAGPELRESAYLELPDGRVLEPVNIRFVEGDRAGEDYTAFEFPRELGGEPTVRPDMATAVFVCKAVSLTPMAGRSNSLALRVTFQPNRMRANNQPDF